MKRISIITINWNNASELRHTIESVVSQMTDECEYVIIDGESDDGSVDIIKAYESHITRWYSRPREGIYAAMNQGIESASGEYCLFLNSGDWLAEGGMQIALEACTGEEIIYFNTYLSYNRNRLEELKYPQTLTMRSFYHRTIGHQSTLIKRELFASYGLYNARHRIHSDYEFWLKTLIVGNCTYKYVNRFLAYYDMGGRSAQPNEQSNLEIQSILKQYLPQRVLDDYAYWESRDRTLKIMEWYRHQKFLYSSLVLFYKIVKNIKRVVSKLSLN